MDNGKILIFLVSFIAFFFSIYELISLIINWKKIKRVKAQIIDIQCRVTDKMKVTNAKLATMKYFIDNKEYISQNTIILPMYREIGDFIEVYYFIDKPTILYKESFNKLFITLVISIICFWAGYSMG